jgi:hypothetical protein
VTLYNLLDELLPKRVKPTIENSEGCKELPQSINKLPFYLDNIISLPLDKGTLPGTKTKLLET